MADRVELLDRVYIDHFVGRCLAARDMSLAPRIDLWKDIDRVTDAGVLERWQTLALDGSRMTLAHADRLPDSDRSAATDDSLPLVHYCNVKED